MPSSWVKNILFNRWKKINVVASMGLVTITNGFECSLEKLQVKGDPRRFFPNPFDAGVQAIMTQETPDYIQDTDKYTQLILSMEPFSI
jgi:ketopantoate reductase